MKIVLYARFSPRPGAADCESDEAQLVELRAWAHRQGHTVVGEFRDRERSGGDADRPGLWEAVAAVPRGGALVVTDPKRLARDVALSVVIEQRLADRGAWVIPISLGDSPAGDDATRRLLSQIMSAVAEYERHATAATTRARMRAYAASGRRVTRPDRMPWGWSADPSDPDGPHLVPCSAEREITHRIGQLRAAGLSWRKVARALSEEGLTCRGNAWHAETCRRIFSKATPDATTRR